MFESRNELQANAEAFTQEAAAAAASLMNDCLAPRSPGVKTDTSEQQESALPSVTLTKGLTNRPVDNSSARSNEQDVCPTSRTKTKAAQKPSGELSEKGIGSIIEHLKQSTWPKINGLAEAVPGRTPEQVPAASRAEVDRTNEASNEKVSTKSLIENLLPKRSKDQGLRGIGFWNETIELQESLSAYSIAEKIKDNSGDISKDKDRKAEIEIELSSMSDRDRAISKINQWLKGSGYEIRPSGSTEHQQEYTIHGKNGAAISHIIVQR